MARNTHAAWANIIKFVEPLDLNILRTYPNGRHFADDKKEKFRISIQTLVKCIRTGQHYRVMAWCRIGAKSSSEPILTKTSVAIWRH